MKEQTKSIESQVMDLIDNPLVKNNLKERMDSNRLVRCLIRMRAAAGLSQEEIARKMKCTQSKISKIEHSSDDELTIGDINAYAQATGNWSMLTLANCKQNLASLIKINVNQANALLRQIIDCAEAEGNVSRADEGISMEMLAAFCRMLEETTAKLPNSRFIKDITNKGIGGRPGEMVVTCSETELALA